MYITKGKIFNFFILNGASRNFYGNLHWSLEKRKTKTKYHAKIDILLIDSEQIKYLEHFKIKIIRQASTLTFVRLSGTSENWRRTSRSCITVVRRDKWKHQILKRAGTTDKSISTGMKYWACCIKESCLISNLSIIYFD